MPKIQIFKRFGVEIGIYNTSGFSIKFLKVIDKHVKQQWNNKHVGGSNQIFAAASLLNKGCFLESPFRNVQKCKLLVIIITIVIANLLLEAEGVFSLQ